MIRWDGAPRAYEVAFTTRQGGVSEGPYASLNLGRATADEPACVEENRRRICAFVGADPAGLTMNYQFHSAVVHRAKRGWRGDRGDGLWTEEPDVPVLALTADCLPVVLARTGGTPAVAVLHVGWRGLLAGIVEAGAAAIGDETAAIVGPGIGPCCYEVGEEVAGAFRATFGGDVVAGRKLDLWTAAERALRSAGVEVVERLDLCTACNPELFFSHRRDGGVTGRQGVIARVAA